MCVCVCVCVHAWCNVYRRRKCIHRAEFHAIIFENDMHPSIWCNVMDCGIVVSEFVLQLRYYVHFRTNTLGKGMNPLILTAMG